MSELAKLRAATTLEDVARLLGFAPNGLSFVLYKIPETLKSLHLLPSAPSKKGK